MSQSVQGRAEGAPGSVLAAVRKELNLSVGDVARHLKLSPAQVEALEQGAYERLPGRVFVRGFLRNYAKLLGIDPQPLLRGIESQIAQPVLAVERPPSPKVVMPHEQPARWPLYTVIAAALIVGALAVYEFGFNEPPQPAQQETDATAAPMGEATPTAPVIETPPASSAPAAATPPAGPAAVGAQQGPPGQIVTAIEQAPTAPRTGARALYFKFDEESWVEVRDRDDRVILSKLKAAGSEERISALPPIKLVVGNARGVRLNSDDQPVDLTPHTGVTVARLTLK